MEIHDVISKLEFMRNGYQKLIDENVDCGTIVGTDITGTWKADTLLNDVYNQHVEALDTAIKVLSAQPERKTGKWIDAQYPFSKCSICECYFDTANNIGNFCPNCGAKMEE